MVNTPAVQSSPAELLTHLGDLLNPIYAECLTDETKKVRNLVLVISLVLMLLALGVISIEQGSWKVPVLGFVVSVEFGLRWVLATLCVYFLVLLGFRTYVEWNLWRLQHQGPAYEMNTLALQIESAFAEKFQAMDTLRDGMQRSTRKVNELLAEGYDPSLETEIQKLKSEGDRYFADHQRALKDPELERLEERIQAIKVLMQPAARSVSYRLWIEALFPIAFGLCSVGLAIFTS